MKILLIGLIVMLLSLSVSAQRVRDDSTRLCRKVSEIRQIPKDRDEKGVDAAYDEIKSAGPALIPCLIDQITDLSITHDPRCPHITEETKIGDVSYFLLVDLLQIEFTQFLPESVKADFRTKGVYAYHEYIETSGARAALQKKLRKVWNNRKRKQAFKLSDRYTIGYRVPKLL